MCEGRCFESQMKIKEDSLEIVEGEYFLKESENEPLEDYNARRVKTAKPTPAEKKAAA